MKPILTATFTAAAALGLSACATNDDGNVFDAPGQPYPGTPLIGELLGEGVEPTPGDPDGNGQFALWADDQLNRLCYTLGVGMIDNPTAAHIHRGGPDEAGPPVVTLQTPTLAGASEGCVAADAGLAAQIIANPNQYYVQVHSGEYPNGAIRSQLMQPDAS